MTSRAICIAFGAILSICGSATARDKETGCPASTFKEFTAAFATSAELQKRFTKFPLAYRYVDNNGAEPKHAHKDISQYGDIPTLDHGLIVPSREERKKVGLELRADAVANNGSWTMRVAKPDTDFGFMLTFARERDCWFLVAIENYSL